jgi:hypothetical protein
MPAFAAEYRPGGRVDDARVDLFSGLDLPAPIRGSVPSDTEVPLEVHANDGVPFFFAAADEHPVAHEASVVDDGIEPTELVDRLPHERLGLLPIRNVRAVGHRLAAHVPNRLHHLVRRALATAFAAVAHAEVVDDDFRALPRKLERMLAADAAPCARYDHYPSFTNASHPQTSASANLTINFPRCSPLNNRSKCDGALSSPSTISSR